MPMSICPTCQRRRAVAEYIAKLPLRCTGCGGALTVVAEEDVVEAEPVAVITDDFELPPLVPLPSEAAKSGPKITDESLSRIQLSDMLKDIASLSATSSPVPARPPAVLPVKPVPALRRFWNRLTRR